MDRQLRGRMIAWLSVWALVLSTLCSEVQAQTPPRTALLPARAIAPCYVSGAIASDTTWGPTLCDPYIITGDVTVNAGVTLTVQPGTRIRFQSDKSLIVQGALVARGTQDNPILFTSDAATPNQGDWRNIHFTDTSTDATFNASGEYTGGSILQYAIVEYAGSSGSEPGAVFIRNSGPYINYCTLRQGGRAGITAWDAVNLRVHTNTVTHNNGEGIWVGMASGEAGIRYNTVNNNLWNGINAFTTYCTVPSCRVAIENNTLEDNGRYGAFLQNGPNSVMSNSMQRNQAGGVRIEHGTGTVSYNSIEENNGPGISLVRGSVLIEHNYIADNHSTVEGGGVFCSWGSGDIRDNTITGNSAPRGGGIYNDNNGCTIRGNIIGRNTSNAEGGGLYIDDSFNGSAIQRNTITNNVAGTENGGGGTYLTSTENYGTSTINDNDIHRNVALGAPNDLTNSKSALASALNATNNYWGVTDAGVIEAHIWHGGDDANLGMADFTPYRDVSAFSTTWTVPRGSVVSTADRTCELSASWQATQTLTITYTGYLSPGHPTGSLQETGITLRLEARDEHDSSVVVPGTPLELRLNYSANLPAGVSESSLRVFRYDQASAAWIPLPLLWRNLGQHTLAVQIDHFSEFALLWPSTKNVLLSLLPGWNLISLPLAPENTAITQALASIAGRYDLAYAYDAGSPAPWKKYNTAAPPFLNTLSVISETQGLWVRANTAVSLTITGTLPVSPAIALKQGWNLVGYPSQTTRPVTVALQSIDGEYDLVYAYDAANQASPWKKYNVAAPAFLNTLKEMGPGWGYWIRATEECVWQLP